LHTRIENGGGDVISFNWKEVSYKQYICFNVTYPSCHMMLVTNNISALMLLIQVAILRSVDDYSVLNCITGTIRFLPRATNTSLEGSKRTAGRRLISRAFSNNGEAQK
jgi:hypothetical protein